MGIKHKAEKCSKYLTASSLLVLVVVLVFVVLMYFELNTIAIMQQLVLVRMGSVVLYVPSEPIFAVYVWDLFWLCVSLFCSGILRIWMPCFWLHTSLAGYICGVVFSPFISYELSIFVVAYFRTMTIYSLLSLQQIIARRDINDRGYEVHQNQFNLIYRRVLHISA